MYVEITNVVYLQLYAFEFVISFITRSLLKCLFGKGCHSKVT